MVQSIRNQNIPEWRQQFITGSTDSGLRFLCICYDHFQKYWCYTLFVFRGANFLGEIVTANFNGASFLTFELQRPLFDCIFIDYTYHHIHYT